MPDAVGAALGICGLHFLDVGISLQFVRMQEPCNKLLPAHPCG